MCMMRGWCCSPFLHQRKAALHYAVNKTHVISYHCYNMTPGVESDIRSEDRRTKILLGLR